MSGDFAEWSARPIHEGELFISDGIVDPDRWNRAKPKILFLLKEAYESDPAVETGWDLCALIRDEWKGPKYTMWWRVARWAYAITELARTGEVAPYPDPRGDVGEALLSSAVVNLKKSGGKSRSSEEDLQRYVESDWDLIERQIAEIDPDLVVAGYTFHLIEDRLGEVEKLAEWIYRAQGRLWVDFWHPANKYPSKLTYYSLATVLRLSGVLRGDVD